MTLRLLILSLLLLLVHVPAAADEVRPGFLELKASGGDAYSVKWKVPMKGDRVLGMQPVLPPSCSERTPPSSSSAGGAMITLWSVSCPGGLAGARVAIEGLESTTTDVLVRLVEADGATRIARLTPAQSSFEVAAKSTTLEVVRLYTVLGVEHILLGIDHLLFVFALLLIVKDWRLLVGTITAFTLAHSITLFAATLGYVHVPQAPVEAVIALSILFLATEIIHGLQGKEGLAARYPWLVAFIFGLLHGFGFAGALAEVGLPEHAIPLALLFFNVGVEIGQLLFVAAVVTGLWLLWKLAPHGSLRKGEAAASYLIGGTAAFWLIERTYSFWA